MQEPIYSNISSAESESDIEKGGDHYEHLINTTVRSFGWEAVTATVKDRQSKQPKAILNNVAGLVKAGEMLALMGPSGCGKTTLLNILAHRCSAGSVEGSMYVNGSQASLIDFRKISSYVEQEVSLVGSLTVRETMYFAGKLSLPSSVSKSEREKKIESLLSAFGLQGQSSTIIGTPIRKGVSGGQKRRVGVASQLMSSPKLLFLDEPTSGLDSAASFEVMEFVKSIAAKYNLIVIASIHQPSTSTFALFDKLLLLSHGRTAYNGSINGVHQHFASLGFEMPRYMNPAEFILDLVNQDFSRNLQKSSQNLERIVAWDDSAVIQEIDMETSRATAGDLDDGLDKANPLFVPFTLVHRSFIKSYRDIVAYQIRIAMYMGLAIMMGTVWLRLDTEQTNINAFTNSIFFGGAFMSFMAVAYIPSYLEDHELYKKERHNGLYGPTAFLISNFIIGLPYLFIITILFSMIAYWLGNFQPTALGFWTWVMYLFLDLLAAESLVVLITSVAPIFVVSLAATAFANGLWMSVNGFMVQPKTLNVFYRYVFHYIDYQAYVFQGMMVNEFGNRNYSCGRGPNGDCQCMFPSALQPQCMIAGTAVLDSYGYKQGKNGLWVGILIGIVAGYRLIAWLVLYLKKH